MKDNCDDRLLVSRQLQKPGCQVPFRRVAGSAFACGSGAVYSGFITGSYQKIPEKMTKFPGFIVYQ
ncbi:MAG TPA: hypothetical protein DHU56_03250 [Marinobacter sp.]|nr:hypothetical protein [Marinobacter sp.]